MLIRQRRQQALHHHGGAHTRHMVAAPDETARVAKQGDTQRGGAIARMDLIGNVQGCDVIIVDDLIDTASTICEAATQLRAQGAKRVFAFATHGIFSGRAPARIAASLLEQVRTQTRTLDLKIRTQQQTRAGPSSPLRSHHSKSISDHSRSRTLRAWLLL